MSAISLKSITGITSITTPSGVDNVFTVHTNDTTERFRVDQTGNLNIAGIVTVTKDLDVDGHTNLDNVSVAGVTTFASNVSVGSSIAVGTGVTIESNGQGTFTGIVTASAFKLSDGSNVGGVESDSRLNTVGGTLSGADIVIGGNSGSSGNDNTLFGWSAGRFIALGDGNSCFGVTAGRNIGAGLWNTFIGGGAGRNMSSSYNTCVGYNAGYMNNAQGYTVAFGYQAGYNATNSGRLTAIGYQAGKAHTGGNGNTYLGYQAGHLNTAGDRNVVIGDLTVSGSSDYNRVTVIGAGAAGGFGSNANNNTVIGYGAASSTLTGENNTIIGNGANPSGNVSNEITLGNSSVSHFRIPGIGVSFSEGGGVTTGIMTASAFKLLDGSAVGGFSPDAQHNLFAGTDAGASLNSSSNNNVLLGQDAGDSITSGYENVCIGLRAGQAITDTRRNTCIGPDAGRNFNAGDSVFIGWNAGSSAGSNGNVCIGHNSGSYAKGNDCAYGYSSGPTQSYSGNTNVCYGFAAGNGISQNATRNTIIGPGAGRNAATGQVNIEGNHNIIIGDEASLSSTTVSNECVIGALDGQSKAITQFRVPGIGLEFAKDHTYGVSSGRKNWFDNGSFDCTYGGRKANTSMDYGNHHAYGWVTDRFMSRNAVQWSRSTNVPTGKGFSYSTQTNGAAGQIMQAVELPDYGDMGVFEPGSYWCVSIWSTASMANSATAFSYDLGSTKTDVILVDNTTNNYVSSGETAAGTSTGTFTRYYKVFQMPSSIISGATGLYFTWGFSAAGYATGWQLERVPTGTSKPTPYEHVHPSVTIARCRRYAYRKYNSRHVNGWKRHDSGVNWEARHPVLPTHMPSGSTQSADPYGVIMHTAGILTNFQSIWQNPGVSSLSRYGFNPADGSFILNGQSSYSGTHIVIPSYEGFEYEVQHGFF